MYVCLLTTQERERQLPPNFTVPQGWFYVQKLGVMDRGKKICFLSVFLQDHPVRHGKQAGHGEILDKPQAHTGAGA